MFTTGFLAIVLVGFGTGALGSMVGIGGGVLLIPLLTLWVGVPIHAAIGASLVAVIATSSAAATAYLHDRLTNVRLAMVLETATASGAILGGLTAALLSRSLLGAIFAGALAVVGISMLRKKEGVSLEEEAKGNLRLGGEYYDHALRRQVSYGVRNLPAGLLVSFLAGNVSGLLGIGGGVIKVPAMVLAMGVPMRAAVATSNFMIGVTAVASAFVYYSRGFVLPQVAVPTAIGVFLGSIIGTRLATRMRGRRLEIIFAVVLLFFAAEMALDVAGIRLC